MRSHSVLAAFCGLVLGAAVLCAQVQPPPAPWRGAGPTPCAGPEGGIYKCPPPPRTIAVRAGRLFDSKSGQMRTLHYDFKGEADSPEQRQACLRSIIEENRKSERL